MVDETEMPLPSNPQTFFLGGLFTVSVDLMWQAPSSFLSCLLSC